MATLRQASQEAKANATFPESITSSVVRTIRKETLNLEEPSFVAIDTATLSPLPPMVVAPSVSGATVGSCAWAAVCTQAREAARATVPTSFRSFISTSIPPMSGSETTSARE
jgi:hypothetical protein